ncbi:lysine-specific demethylase phf2 isoform X2 [Cephus cinctus]|uniref:Lysine-specific demethylase phf2 isoform X2 n=1 Tax=Cephus cinctus TaxID=211228 RepID=A0AAJ7BTZ9_CEPCN|nr:lysine-specific demethylase phf2 isoform X2 [Cephus cinctus]
MELPATYCLCGNSFDSDQFMIQCDICKEWYHGGCVAVKDYMSMDLDKYHCPRCETTCGPSLLKIRMNWHRHDYLEGNADSKPVQTGTPLFIKELKSRHFPKADEVVRHVRGQQLTLQYLQSNGFEAPIVIDGKDGLDMTVPPPNFSVYDVESYIGGDREMDVIDVTRQSNVRMKLRDFVEYYNDPCRTRVFNVISLEFSNTSLSSMVEAPYIARKLDWANSVWPRDWPEDSELKRPEVQKYCLMGVKDSFTDFHIDFGGTSVWYHVLRGEKVFYLVKPSTANLQLYQHWMCSSTQSETFFGDQADACYRCVIKQGQTMMIPTGWIHAVLTPTDSLVFGGNFVHSLNIPMQIQVYELERKMKTPTKFQYPGFETINWFAGKKLLKDLKELNNDEKKCPAYFLQGVKALLGILKQWNTDKDYNMVSRSQIPETINSPKLLKDLSKEIRHAERYLISLNPPKPERESKRKKKKPLNKDFIDYDVADRMAANPFKATLKETNKMQEASMSTELLPDTRPPLKLTLPKYAGYSYASTNLPPDETSASAAVTSATSNSINNNISSSNNSNSSSSNSSNSAGGVGGGTSGGNGRKVKCVGFSQQNKRASKPGKQSPTVIRFKLGDNEVVRSTHDNINNYGTFTMDHSVETLRELTWKQSSVYDFHDGSNESDYGVFTIDEAPKRKKSSRSSSQKRCRRNYQPAAGSTDDADVQSEIPKNGIEELLKASAYTLSSATVANQRLDATTRSSAILSTMSQFGQPVPPPTGSGRASPSTREAIAGMLSFSEQCYSTTSASPVKLKKFEKEDKKLQDNNDDDDDDHLIENIDKVHQDDDFIYPALDASDDEEYIFKPRGKRRIDEAWNPRARVGPLLPKTNRPAREGVKKTSVEKGLEAAAAKRAKQPQTSTKRTYNKRRQKGSVMRSEAPPIPADGGNIKMKATSDGIMNMGLGLGLELDVGANLPTDGVGIDIGGYGSILTSPNRLKDVKAKLAAPVPVERKPKKGMKTAKQRLGKILKLHKMMH